MAAVTCWLQARSGSVAHVITSTLNSVNRIVLILRFIKETPRLYFLEHNPETCRVQMSSSQRLSGCYAEVRYAPNIFALRHQRVLPLVWPRRDAASTNMRTGRTAASATSAFGPWILS